MERIAGTIPAGGLSRLVGSGDKALRPLARRPLLAHVAARIAPQADRLAVKANGDPARFDGFGLPVLRDDIADHPGPLAGILAAMNWAARARVVEFNGAPTPVSNLNSPEVFDRTEDALR